MNQNGYYFEINTDIDLNKLHEIDTSSNKKQFFELLDKFGIMGINDEYVPIQLYKSSWFDTEDYEHLYKTGQTIESFVDTFLM